MWSRVFARSDRVAASASRSPETPLKELSANWGQNTTRQRETAPDAVADVNTQWSSVVELLVITTADRCSYV